ncbi:LuxR family transcriptional regulator [Planobispora siamensis]|uniref:LuxR family transcriptional regulator n=1 Tax=Planobispora siamensis TaxID=936338 RepID=A0A8J3WNE6_9ACTN|nr:LuxR family transcriptional regulator [Planobispora siamensis]GIH95750.1 LuxR family transcriptional regulator [Planobispora siamensis]
MDRWPFAGREAEREQVAAALLGRSVLISGPAGVGKSRLASEVAAAFTGRGEVVRVGATRAAQTIPLGVFAPFLPRGEAGSNLLGWAGEAILSLDPVLLVVDDAHLLDAASAVLVHQLAGDLRVLATVRTDRDCPDPVTALWKDDLADRFDLAPLARDKVTEVLVAALGGPVEPATADRLYTLTQGNPLLLRELVTAARDGSALAPAHGGVWRLCGEVPYVPRLIELIERRMGRLGDDETAVMEFVALGEPLDVAVLTTLTGRETVERVEARGLIRVAADGRRTVVRLAHPLYGDAVRARLPGLRSRRRHRDLAESIETLGARRREDVLRIAQWRLESGVVPDPAPLVRACRLAWAAHDYSLAIRLARASFEHGGGIDSAIMLGTLFNYAGRPAEAEAVLARVWEHPCDERQRTELALTRAWSLGLGLGRIEEAVGLLSRIRDEVTEVKHRQDLTLLMLINMSNDSSPREILTLVEALLAEPPATAAISAQALNTRAAALGLCGRYREALAEARRALANVGDWLEIVPVIVMPLHGNWAISAMCMGDLTEMEAAADSLAGMLEGQREFPQAVHALVFYRAMAARLRGRPVEAAQLLRDSGPGALGGATGMCLLEYAQALALSGDVHGARQALEQARTTRTRFFLTERMLLAVTEPWVSAASGELTRAVELAVAAAAAAHEAGAVAFETVALHDLVRLGAPGRAVDRLAELAELQDGDLAQVFAAHALAAARGDGPGLDAVTSDFERLGFLPYAVESAAQAAEAFRRAGRAASARRASARAGALASRCEEFRTPALARLTVPELTRRQEEVARLAATGLTNRDIAERLVLSVRTVQNHLQDVFNKLGVSRRTDLGPLLGE